MIFTTIIALLINNLKLNIMKSKIHEYQKAIKKISKTKTILLLVVTFSLWGLQGCTKDAEKGDPVFALPPETQVGANTFGVTINGKVYVPRDPTGVNVGGATPKGMRLLGGGIPPNDYTEIVVVDGASAVGFKLIIHLQNLFSAGTYVLEQSNFENQADSILENHLFFRIYDTSINNYAYYGSIANQGELNNTRHSNGIISGNFKGKFVRYDNPNEYITITDGRFDINTATIENAIFP
jgi:hypothetical protein